MFKDSLPSYQLPQPNDLSVPPKHEVEQIVSFIDNHIADFPHYYNQNKDSVRENWISNLLVRHFNLCNCENGGYLPYEFSKTPPQASSTRERFKKGEHSKHLKECGMFAYVQSRTIEEWFSKVNGWVIYQSQNSINESIDWTEDEQLAKVSLLGSVEKFASCHKRNISNDTIFLWHYFIDLTP